MLSCDRSLAAPPSALSVCTRPPTPRLPSHGATHARPTPALPLCTCITTAPPPHCPLPTARLPPLSHACPAPLDAISSLRPTPCRLRHHGLLLCAATPVPCSRHLRPLHPASSMRVRCWPCRSVPHPPAPPRALFLAPQLTHRRVVWAFTAGGATATPVRFRLHPHMLRALVPVSPHARPNPRPHLHLSPMYSPPSLCARPRPIPPLHAPVSIPAR
ncbi:hypothetical protein B0H14DRAFT_905248 [Mycena olivaceomarginata]|nr:hypothetical protein B0H14DRAFT_905248 [Mycena olivaceomarginata]